MEHMDEQDILRLKELLRRTGEFIAYFEFAETKMMEWRQDIELRASSHQQQFQERLCSLQTELNSLQEIFTQAGLARFRLTAENALKQGKEYLTAMQQIEQQILTHLSNNQKQLSKFCEQAVTEINQHTMHALERIDNQLSQYDPQHFHRIANESCEQVAKSANHVILKSDKLLRMFQWRTVALAFLTSLLTAFSIGLYISDEFPWEIHQHAMNERGAGKMLMNAWSKLSYQEK
ncbi:hypothetical protein Loa_00114 [Legionella oakridgensis ATCC 33761 = DSM 21215]|uniref:Uncharacterized protein n=2 Tax=Legionella oakridgensis TaxID=29423 RepID=W0B760_9GAMM|nr:hypothetical protein [Legionella oakridgensis]AHE65705.1 hypothetical protein Loa_00114 [Legionella oakridgensis ATCC 33761 = DSM 21215]